MSKSSIIYVDGFNLYYGALKGTKWKWLDLQRYFEMLRQDDDIQLIKYFTAPVLGSHRKAQETYLLALATLPKVEIILGKFKSKTYECRVRACRHRGLRLYENYEEKRTDVSIGIHMVYDALTDQADRIVLITGDSDLVPAISMIKRIKAEKEIIAYIPANDPIRGAAVELRSAVNKDRTLPNALLRHAQFSKQILTGMGDWIVKPANW